MLIVQVMKIGSLETMDLEEAVNQYLLSDQEIAYLANGSPVKLEKVLIKNGKKVKTENTVIKAIDFKIKVTA